LIENNIKHLSAVVELTKHLDFEPGVQVTGVEVESFSAQPA